MDPGDEDFKNHYIHDSDEIGDSIRSRCRRVSRQDILTMMRGCNGSH